MAGSKWYFAIDDQRYGPITSRQLRKLVRSEALTPDSLVWKSGLSNWVSASRVKGLCPIAISCPISDSGEKRSVGMGSRRLQLSSSGKSPLSSDSVRFLEGLNVGVREARRISTEEPDEEEPSGKSVIHNKASSETDRAPPGGESGVKLHQPKQRLSRSKYRLPPSILTNAAASIGSRCGALFVDLLVQVLVSIPLLLILISVIHQLSPDSIPSPDSSIQEIVPFMIWLVIPCEMAGFLLNFLFEISSRGASLGKTLMGLCVVELSGHSLSVSASVIRHFIKFGSASFLLLVFLADFQLFVIVSISVGSVLAFGPCLMLWTPMRRTLGDLVSGTVVVDCERLEIAWRSFEELDPALLAHELRINAKDFSLSSRPPRDVRIADTLERVFAAVLDFCISADLFLVTALLCDVAFSHFFDSAGVTPKVNRQSLFGLELPTALTLQLALPGCVVVFLYHWIMEASRLKATFGKLALGIRVADEPGYPPYSQWILLRQVVKHSPLFFLVFSCVYEKLTLFIPCLLLNLFLLPVPALTSRKQSLHDLVAGTIVIHGK